MHTKELAEMVLARIANGRSLADADCGQIARDFLALREALREISECHLGDCPVTMEEIEFAKSHIYRLRKMARDALQATPDSATKKESKDA